MTQQPKEGGVTWRVCIDELPQHIQRSEALVRLSRANTDGLNIDITYDDGTHLTFQSEPLQVESGRRVEIFATWIEPAVVLELNGIPLEAYQPGQRTRVIELPEPNLDEPSALDHPRREECCQEWVLARQEYFTGLAPRARDRRPKSVDEQCDDLRRAIASIDVLLYEIERGKLFLAAYLAGTLRALIVWGDKEHTRANYNALLLRLANLGSLPLPVWAIRSPIPDLCCPDHPICVSGNFARLMKAEAEDELMDLQEWLSTPVVARWDAELGCERRVSVRDLISEVSNTLGGSHFDLDTSVFGDILMSIGSGSTSYWLRFLGGCADIVSAYSKWVLDELHNAGITSYGWQLQDSSSDSGAQGSQGGR